MKGVIRFGKKGKLSPRFIRHFEILIRGGEVAYMLALPPSLSAVHPVFHVSMLPKYIPDKSHVLSLDTVKLGPDFKFEEDQGDCFSDNAIEAPISRGGNLGDRV